MERRKKLWSACLTLILILLFLSMLFLFGTYIGIRNRGQAPTLPQMPEKDKWIFSRGGIGPETEQNEAYLVPSFFGVHADGRYASPGFQEELRGELADFVEPLIGTLFAGKSTLISFDSPAHRQAYFADLAASEPFVLLEFYGEIPADCFLPFLAEDYEEKRSSHAFGVKQLFLLCGEDSRATAVAITEQGDVYQVESDQEDVFFNKDFILAYNNKAELSDFEFASANSLIPLYSRETEAPYATASAYLPPAQDPFSAEAISIQRAFLFNPNNLRHYVSPDGSLSYVDQTGELTWSYTGAVSFAAYDTGIPLSEFLGYSPAGYSPAGYDSAAGPGETYSFADYTLAAKRILSRFDRDKLGRDAVPGLVKVEYRAETGWLVFSFQYFLNGIAFEDSGADITLAFQSNALVMADIRFLSVTEHADGFRDIPQTLAFVLTGEKDGVIHFLPIYRYVEEEGRYRPGWVLKQLVAEE